MRSSWRYKRNTPISGRKKTQRSFWIETCETSIDGFTVDVREKVEPQPFRVLSLQCRYDQPGTKIRATYADVYDVGERLPCVTPPFTRTYLIRKTNEPLKRLFNDLSDDLRSLRVRGSKSGV